MAAHNVDCMYMKLLEVNEESFCDCGGTSIETPREPMELALGYYRKRSYLRSYSSTFLRSARPGAFFGLPYTPKTSHLSWFRYWVV